MFLDPYSLPLYLLMLAVFIPVFGVAVLIHKLWKSR